MSNPVGQSVEDITHRLCHNGMPHDSGINDLCIEAAAFIANMSARLAALEADARRYRWLRRACDDPYVSEKFVNICESEPATPELFDAAIDAAKSPLG